MGIDPGPNRASYPVRLITLFATMAIHAFFGVAVMGSTEVLGAGWWTAMGGATTTELLADQAIGGSIAWGAGELPVVLAALVVAVQWSRDDQRRARRLDRRADRNGDIELTRCNAYLRALAEERGETR
ncbi:cytochrome c oxidase assembly protein [Cellulomonas sp. Y8]|uniref:cytochrome c oxidase assembly protein n=1 Tax=Cellulomonas sp. Y8 TaxID=2591145 RepID=UPI003D7207ED